MQETIQQLGDILLKALPTFFFVVLLHFYLKFIFFKPMEKVLHDRYLATEGARKVAQDSLERAAAKTAQYEAAVRAARNEIYQAEERRHKEWQEKETAALTASRQKAEALIKEAKAQLAQDMETAKVSLARDSEVLANQIAETLLRLERRMTRPLRLILLLFALALFAFAQEEKKAEAHEEKKAEAHSGEKAAGHEEKKGHEGGGGEEEEDPNMQMWKWANFLILAGALAYGIGKGAPAFFAARSQQITKEMAAAQAERQAAEERAAAVDKRLANLEVEIAALRADAQKASEVDAGRQAQHSADEIAKIQAHAEQEIISAGKAARLDLKRHASELAIGLAEQKIRARLTPETQDELVKGFVRDLQ